MAELTYYTVTVDTEEEWDWNAGWPVRDLAVTNARVLPKFQELCTRYAVRPTYFTNLAILDNAESRRILQDVAQSDGVEIGMHIHPWNTPPVATDTTPTARTTFLRNLPDEAIRAKLGAVYDGFERLGMRPTSFRGGRDRKSTRLNSSHLGSSYAVVCLKTKIPRRAA